MKWMLIMLIHAFMGMASAEEPASKEQPKQQTACISKQDLDKESAKAYRKYRGICLPKADGQGYACVKKSLFRKSNCVGMEVVSAEEGR